MKREGYTVLSDGHIVAKDGMISVSPYLFQLVIKRFSIGASIVISLLIGLNIATSTIKREMNQVPRGYINYGLNK